MEILGKMSLIAGDALDIQVKISMHCLQSRGPSLSAGGRLHFLRHSLYDIHWTAARVTLNVEFLL